MSDADKVDFNFRYRPNADSPDAILVRYLNGYKPSERRQMILKALRAFYLAPAYGKLEEIENISELEEMVRHLRKTYGDGYDSHSFGVDIELNVGMSSYFGFSTMPGGEEEEDDD